MLHPKFGDSYHGQSEALMGLATKTVIKNRVSNSARELEYRFYNHAHPYVSELVQMLLEKSVKGLQDADTELGVDQIFTATAYDPSNLDPDKGVVKLKPTRELDFDPNGPYAVYNWELFFHVPLTVAIHLSKNQRFEEAMRWFHYVFDPTDNSNGVTPDRYWKVQPFRTTPVEMIEEILVNLAEPTNETLLRHTLGVLRTS